jgi:hypothetical protein
VLDEAGVLEAFILLAMPDEGIAFDHARYFDTDSATLRRYVKEFVLTGGGKLR